MSGEIRFGSWLLQFVPPGWEVLPGQGVRCGGDESIRSTIIFSEEKLPVGASLSTYIENQLTAIKVVFNNPELKGPMSVGITGAKEAQRVGVSYASADGREVIHVQVYATVADVVAIATLTTGPESAREMGRMFNEVTAKSRLQSLSIQEKNSAENKRDG